MITFLFVAICIIFMGLGLPDSVLNCAWPAIYSELDLPISYANFITVLVSLGTVFSSLFASRLINKFGIGYVTLVSTFFSALCLLAFSFSNSMLFFCLLSIPLGLGAGAIDTALNNFTATNYSSLHMSLLHCFYGVGISISPFLMSFALGDNNNWRKGYVLVFVVMMVITLVAFISLPLWKKQPTIVLEDGTETELDSKALTLPEIFAIKGAKPLLFMFFCYCALEQTAGLWASSYLVLKYGVDSETAASYGCLFFLGMTLGRAISGFISMKLNDNQMIRLGQVVILFGLFLMFLPFDYHIALIGIVVIGLGCAPIYPCIIHSTPENFGADKSQALIGVQMASAYTGNLVMAPLFGIIANHIGVGLFPFYLFAFLVIMYGMHKRLLNDITK